MDILDLVNPLKIQPEEIHVVLVERFSGNQRILPLQFCKDKFGEERWMKISIGSDNAFYQFPYDATR